MISIKDYVKAKKDVLRMILDRYGRKPKLLIVIFQEDASNLSYVNGLRKDCNEIGIICQILNLSQEISSFELIKSEPFDAIIVQNPIPHEVNIDKLKRMIPIEKDVDNFTGHSFFEPCTPKGTIDYLRYNKYPFDKKHACVVGRSQTVGKPLFDILIRNNCTVSLCHSKTPENKLRQILRTSDIIFTCTNQVEQFDESYISDWQDVVDFGFGLTKDGELCGNITRDCADHLKQTSKSKCIISGVGGTGPLTRVALMENIIEASKRNRRDYVDFP